MLRKAFVLALKLLVIECVIYNGTCPSKEFKLHRNFSCADVFGHDKEFKVLAQLPTSNASLNLFHNPMGAIDDLEVQLMCTGFGRDLRKEPETVKFFLSCNDTSNKDARFAFGCNYKSLNTSIRAWDVITYDNCQPPSFWNSANLVSYLPLMYAVIWGCRDLPNNQHEQGAWILGYKGNFSESAKFLDRAVNLDLNFTKARTSDFILYNQTFAGKATACSSKVCEYNLLCKNDDDNSKEIE